MANMTNDNKLIFKALDEILATVNQIQDENKMLKKIAQYFYDEKIKRTKIKYGGDTRKHKIHKG